MACTMLADFSIIPIGTGAHTSDELGEVLKIVDASGVRYQLTPTATCLEGRWDEIMPLIRKCHDAVREKCPHVVTVIKIEDDKAERNKLSENIRAVEEKAGRDLRVGEQPAAPGLLDAGSQPNDRR